MSIGNVVVVEGLGVQVERIEIVDSLDSGFDEPKGGYRYVIVTVQMLNASDGSKDYGEGDFTASGAQRGWDVDRKLLNYPDQLLENGRPGAEEYAPGQIVFEVDQDATQITMHFNSSLGGGSGYWVLDFKQALATHCHLL